MLPVNSNTAVQGCSPVSSNCVIWQGPNITCLSLCTGDSISSVVYKLAVEVCQLKTDAGLTDLDLSALLQVCQATPEPVRTLSAVLTLLIDKIVCLNDIVEGLPSGGGSSYTEPTLNLPLCLQYINGQGQTVTSLIHNQFTLTLATKLCAIDTLVNSHTGQITSIDNRVTVLESATGTVIPTVIPNCLLTPGTAVNINVLLDELEAQYCNLRTVLGSNNALSVAIAQQCSGLGSTQALSAAGTVSSLPGWNNTVSNVAQSFQNLWVVLCDMRQAIYDIKDCCGQTDCSQFLLGFTGATNNDRTAVTVFFSGGATVIPSGFTNCTAQGSKITISDLSGHSYVAYVDLLTAASDVDGITYTVSGSNLNPAQNYTITVEGCITKNGNVCSKTVNYIVSAPCPIITSVTATLQ